MYILHYRAIKLYKTVFFKIKNVSRYIIFLGCLVLTRSTKKSNKLKMQIALD